MIISPQPKRSGFSLMEVITALTIFLLSLVALSQLMNISSDMASDAQFLHEANQLAQKQMNGVVGGWVPLTSQSATSFDENPDWTWSIDCQADSTANLWHVTITVSRKRADGSSFERSLYQMVVDPTARGGAATPNSATTSGSGSTTPSSGGTMP
jgi:prepilin-type N-terminal cleavage/methylation domain-containing protein